MEFIGYSKPQVPEYEDGNKNCYNEFMVNMFAQIDALALGRDSEELFKNFEGDRCSFVILFKDSVNPFNLGVLFSLYENRIATEGFVYGINSFDQFGV